MKKLLSVLLVVAIMMLPVGVLAASAITFTDANRQVWLTEKDLVKANTLVSYEGERVEDVVELVFTEEGRVKFKEATAAVSQMDNNRLRIVLFGETLINPQVFEEIDRDSVAVYGNFETAEEAQVMADRINMAIRGQRFSDISDEHWAYGYVIEMANRGIINGYADGTFRPEAFVTRAEFAKMLEGAAELGWMRPTNRFVDVDAGAWHAGYVESVGDYILGSSDGTVFLPDHDITRGEVAAALVRVKGYDLDLADLSYVNEFGDFRQWNAEETMYIAVAVEHGLMRGHANNMFAPHAPLTRAEAATLLSRTFGK
jgi:hypothetical protein